MMRRIGILLCACSLLLGLASCSGFGIPDYTLTVTIEAGVTGTPAAGTYTYKDLSEVEYRYWVLDEEQTVEVLVDGGSEDAIATLVMYHDTVLLARLFDPRGKWKVTLIETSGSSIEFTLTLSGASTLGGDFSDSRGYSGTWKASDGIITITFADWNGRVLSGSLPGMSGLWTEGEAVGNWSASRSE